MLGDIFIEFKDSAIQGDSRDVAHPGSIEISRFAQTILAPDCCETQPERVRFSDLIFSKDRDIATPALIAACASGTVFPWIKVHFYQYCPGSSGTAARKPRYRLVLHACIVSSIVPADVADADPFETFTLKPLVMCWQYQGDTGLLP